MTVQLASALLQAMAIAGSPFAYVPPVDQPRSFGHFVGDVLTQRIPLDQSGVRFRPRGLPAADRVGLWLQRRPPRLETDAQGGLWLVIDYQIINSPRLPITAALPALNIANDAGAPLQVSAWPVSISPLRAPPAYSALEPQPLLADRKAPTVPTGPLQRQLVGWSVGLAMVLMAWSACIAWRNRREARRLPFARALRELQDIDSPDDDANAWICLHRALNAAAGRMLQSGSLPALLAAVPQWQPLRGELEAFYRQSDARFFASSVQHGSFPLVNLCRKLRRIEKRHALRV